VVDPDDLLSAALDRQATRHDTENFARTLSRAVDAKAHYFPGHADCVAFLVTFIANQLGLPQEFLRYCAMFHDAGKLMIPSELLLRNGRLTEEEYEVIKTHCEWGQKILDAAGLPEIGVIVRHHHEHWDGSGYPDGLAGEAIPLEARVIHVADAYAVMVIDRTYKEPVDAVIALTELRRCAGTQFDPRIVSLFTQGLDGLIDVMS
jgi:putative nucleotidyltransferase with HDIG domain